MALKRVVMRSLPLWLSAAWVMSLTTLGFFVVPMLFANLPSPAIAGAMAAKLFAAQTAVSTACALVLVLVLRAPGAAVPDAIGQSIAMWALGGALLALLVQFGVSPRIIARENLALWHGLGSAMYFVQWLCALMSFGKLTRFATPSI
jgi:hypothetical protein